MAETNSLLRHLIMQADNRTLTSTELNPPFTPVPSAVRQNCIFFASLFSSLLAAAGAVLAKQWLANYERTGQTGTFKTQGLLRTQKFLGAEKWKLRYVVEALPMLILISLGLFFIAMADYVWTINTQVAIVITSFSAVGTLFYAAMVIAAVLDPQCPFQTSPCPFQTSPSMILFDISPAVKRGVRGLVLRALVGGSMVVSLVIASALDPKIRFSTLSTMLSDAWRTVQRGVKGLTHRGSVLAQEMMSFFEDKLGPWMRSLARPTLIQPARWPVRINSYAIEKHAALQKLKDWQPNMERPAETVRRLQTESAKFIMTVAPRNEVVLSVCSLVASLSRLEDVRAVATKSLTLTATFLLTSILKSLQGQPDSGLQESALSIAKALTHIMLASPAKDGTEVLNILGPYDARNDLSDLWWITSPDLKIQVICVALMAEPSASWSQLFISTIDGAFADLSKVSDSTVAMYLQCLSLCGWDPQSGQWIGLEHETSFLHQLIFSPIVPSSEVFLRAASATLATLLAKEGDIVQPWADWESAATRVWAVYG